MSVPTSTKQSIVIQFLNGEIETIPLPSDDVRALTEHGLAIRKSLYQRELSEDSRPKTRSVGQSEQNEDYEVDQWEVSHIVDSKGRKGPDRKYRVRWVGWSDKETV